MIVSASEDPKSVSELEQNREFRLLAESIPNLAWIAWADGSIYWYNQRWYEYTGTTPEQMEGWGWQVVHDPNVLPKVLRRWENSIRTGEPFDMTFPLKGVDGVYRLFLTRVVPLKDEAGNVSRWFGTNTEVGSELRAFAALKESELRFRTATEAISGVLWTNDAAGEMQGEQTGWSAFTGQTAEQYRGYGWASAIHPDDAQPTIDAWQSAVRESRLFSFEHRVRRHDGEYRLCSVRALPVRNDEGSIREWVGVHTDITEDRKTRLVLQETVAALKQQEELVEASQITNNVGFWRYHPASGSVFLSAGTRHLLGVAPTGELPLSDTFANVHPEDVPRIERALIESLTSRQFRQEFRVAAASGSFRWILGVARVFHSEENGDYFVGMNLDVTQQKQSDEALIRTEKLAVAGRLAASIAHEINNPLEAISNLLYLLRQTDLDAAQMEFCDTMFEELQRVSEIATHTLRFHRQSTRPNHARLQPLIESVLSLFAGRLRNGAVTTECRMLASGAVFGFDGELRQVLANLVGNAIDAMTGSAGGRKLFIRTRDAKRGSSDAGVVVTIADSGPGIAAEVMRRIFDPFFTTKGETGTGLGLWVSSEIVRKHQGTIAVRSRQAHHQHGTVFRLFLPLQSSLRQ